LGAVCTLPALKTEAQRQSAAVVAGVHAQDEQAFKVGDRIGRLDDEDMVRLNRAIPVVLGLAASLRTPLRA